jgi:hypothetical protein
MSAVESWGQKLTPLCAVLTLPVGILAAMFVGFEAAAAVFVFGWLLLVPATAVLFGPSYGVDSELKEAMNERMKAEIEESVDESTRKSRHDPIAEARQQYARGEIDEQELERRLEMLLETEDVDPSDEEAIERTVEHISEPQTNRDQGLLTEE